MDQSLGQAYEVIFGFSPSEKIEDWQIAELLINNFNVRLLGEDLAKEVIFQVVNHTFYPDQETTTRIVGRAESLASELFNNISDEPHMAELEWLENQKIKPDQ